MTESKPKGETRKGTTAEVRDGEEAHKGVKRRVARLADVTAMAALPPALPGSGERAMPRVDAMATTPLQSPGSDVAKMAEPPTPLVPVEPLAAEQPTRSVGGWRRYGVSAGLALLALPLIVLAIWPTLVSYPNGSASGRSAAQLTAADWITRVLSVGDLSPNGVDASQLTAKEALQRAEQAVFDANDAGNVAERRFWLRKSIALMLAEPRSRWALTQLGALETVPKGVGQEPEYSAAKSLWEIAAASGDAVATCFIAQLYAWGLGVPESEAHAKLWRERADRQGGCNLKHERPAPALTN